VIKEAEGRVVSSFFSCCRSQTHETYETHRHPAFSWLVSLLFSLDLDIVFLGHVCGLLLLYLEVFRQLQDELA